MFSRVFVVWIAVVAATLSAAAHAATFTGLYAFGDSLTDIGNFSPPLPFGGFTVPPYATGRFSNGPIWIDGVAAGLGLELSASGPSAPGGNDYAVGGAQTSGVVGSEVPLFLSRHGDVADPTALYVLLAGGNDYLLGSGNANAAATNVINSINDLKAAGARDFLVSNLPDLALVPASHGNATARQFTLVFNAALATGLASLTGVKIFGLDLFSLVDGAVAPGNPYGFTNVNTPCWNGVTVCANPNQYVFWDEFHPTTYAHSLLANAALLVTPEPGTLLLVATGVVGLAAKRV
jgi:outer membrane lipase/esterase